ncbi:hypothetical protein [Micromonospora sp. C81]|uniref:hypothetical protein n=1 Tax=Micromonospora sp. C81 TaxID=2824881 RepID=UPI001B38F1A0|nr:hypothetical protein [Micromonospora sp. C81]MBQ1036618.1 hypothetical protein [Micromonospora sp. C81]
MLRLPANTDLTLGGDCRTVQGTPRTWLCGGAELPAGGERVYRLTVASTAAEPVFGACEILRPNVLADGATDSFDVRLAVTGGTKTVKVSLSPANRYTNKDTALTLRLNGSGGQVPATPPPRQRPLRPPRRAGTPS